MTAFDKILYLADYMEPTRDFDGVEELRRLVWEEPGPGHDPRAGDERRGAWKREGPRPSRYPGHSGRTKEENAVRDRSFSQEERMQREKEARSRQRKQEQAYREAQRGVYSRIYEEQNAMPEDYRQAFWEDPGTGCTTGTTPAGRNPTRKRTGRRKPASRSRRICGTIPGPSLPPPGGGQRPRRRRSPKRPTGQRAPEEPVQNHRYREEEEDAWQPIVSRQSAGEEGAPRKRGAQPPRRGRKGDSLDPGGGQPPRKRRRRKVLLIVLIVLLALVAAGVIIHQIYVRPPEIPSQETSQGTDPGVLGAGRRDGVYTFLLVGRDDGGGGNTDTIMVGCYDVKNATLDVLSIYRDTLVDVPWEIKKINSVYNNQGMEGVQQQVKNLIGYVPDYYFVVELDAVAELVDAIGGVDYNVPYNMDYDDPSQGLSIHFQAGMQHLSGEDAVKVLRWRKNNSGENLSVGDVGRVSVQHSFLQALAQEMLSLGTITKIGDIVDIMNRNLESNLNYGEMIWFGEQFLLAGDTEIRFHNLPGDYTGTLWSQTYQNYQSYVFVNSSALLELVNTYLNPYQAEITSDMQHVIYDTTVNNLPVEGTTEESSAETQSGGTTE